MNSQSNPLHVLFSETDKQSSSATRFPYFRRPIKNYETMQHLELSFSAFLHRGKELNIFINLPCHGKSSNHSLTLRFLDLIRYCDKHNGIPQFIQRMWNLRIAFSFLYFLFSVCSVDRFMCF